ncbi:MAG: NfeD family protein [Weeksellaceae bacterium]|jgi:membrane protein implicated in regulation of membrane protease activity|nr:NfeD family protein [Weeksellaceae bacterium]MDX9704905.1 NfeD family protein [Weeksellaceae bacterium]
MFDFLSNSEPLLQGFWYVALISSLIFLIQTIFTLIGGFDTDGISADFDGNLDHVDVPFQFFSFRNLINFMLGFSWTGIAFYSDISNHFFLVLLAVIVGVVFIFLFFVLIKQITKLAEDNTFQHKNLLHKTGTVYLTIPGNMSGVGKIQVSVNGTSHELAAMTEETERLPSGTPIQVEKIKEKTIIVKKTQ